MAEKIKLTQSARDTLALIQRSPQDADGWCKVSELLRPHTVSWLKSAEELYEFDGTRIRLTPEGKIVVKYI